ncbi:MAG: hypothetical protein CMF62_00130 [Magnetococcales bacterium]|nr:hypothetical protein [Magnetococcales bacterium]|tara:strand:+ start:5462 stop:6046 length:585 start_codon:yes stop_codon:yes gene_type:complete
MAFVKRLRKELEQLKNAPLENCSADLVNKIDFSVWKATIKGPVDTPYEDGTFNLSMVFTKEYPFKPPKIKFLTKIYHPNIDEDGNICLDILSNNWSPALSVSKVLLSISSLLEDPNPNDPLLPSAANLYISNKQLYNKKVKEYVLMYAVKKENSTLDNRNKLSKNIWSLKSSEPSEPLPHDYEYVEEVSDSDDE